MSTRFQLTLLTNPYTAYSTSHPFRCKTKDVVKRCVLRILDEVNVTRCILRILDEVNGYKMRIAHFG
jgi:hypothetical protein